MQLEVAILQERWITAPYLENLKTAYCGNHMFWDSNSLKYETNYLFTVCPWTNLSFFICKRGIIIEFIS